MALYLYSILIRSTLAAIEPANFPITSTDGEITLSLPRPITDTPELFSLIEESRPYLEEWLDWVSEIKNEEILLRLLQRLVRNFQEDNGIPLVIRYRNEIAGQIGIHSVYRPYCRGEIFYWVAEPFAGKKIAPRACKALIGLAFKKLGFHRLEIRCIPENTRSSAIPKQLKFTHEGTLKDSIFVNGVYRSSDVYRMLEDEWRLQYL